MGHDQAPFPIRQIACVALGIPQGRGQEYRKCMHAANVLPIIRQIAAGGAALRQIADELNTRGIKTARGGLWYAGTVRNVMAQDNEIEAKAA